MIKYIHNNTSIVIYTRNKKLLEIIEKALEMSIEGINVKKFIIYDLSYPDEESMGLEGILVQSRDIKFLILTETLQVNECCSLMSNGAHGYASTKVTIEKLSFIIDSIFISGLYVESDCLMSMLDSYSNLNSNTLHLDIGELSKKEQELFSLTSEGLSNKNIAMRLNISEKTVKNRISILIEKLGVKNKISLVATKK